MKDSVIVQNISSTLPYLRFTHFVLQSVDSKQKFKTSSKLLRR
jgi:hypothetical protein